MSTQSTGPEAMRWPTWRHRLLPVTAYRWPAYNGFSLWGPSWYYGWWAHLSLGWWAVQIGSGTYDD